ncbi:hypothetical protein ACNO65_23405 [Vibrio campbellii]|uniref:hypothetical protein n=1 Tax=Vibrio campbellii TaxID=680 RepID=UPI00249A78E7|nr:hypothetical protein [Vibrio campbellii]
MKSLKSVLRKHLVKATDEKKVLETLSLTESSKVSGGSSSICSCGKTKTGGSVIMN